MKRIVLYVEHATPSSQVRPTSSWRSLHTGTVDLSLPGMVAADADAASAGMRASEAIAAKTFDHAHM